MFLSTSQELLQYRVSSMQIGGRNDQTFTVCLEAAYLWNQTSTQKWTLPRDYHFRAINLE